ncbi:MAG: hypothetical protein ACJAVM_000734 [Sulfitobacter sp.]|jgi:uncharacterized protein YjiS (DUF1127 family)
MAYINTTSAARTSFFAQIGAFFETAATRYKQHRLYRATFDELSALSNRELSDLGIHRSDLRRVSMEASRA